MKAKISTDQERRIIDDFATEILTKRREGNKPEDTVIEFRNDRQTGSIYWIRNHRGCCCFTQQEIYWNRIKTGIF